MISVTHISDLDVIQKIVFTIAGKKYYGVQDLIMRLDVNDISEKFVITDKDSNNPVNTHEFMWVMLREVFQKEQDKVLEDFEITEEELMEALIKHY